MFKVCRNYVFGTRGYAHQILTYLNLNRIVKQQLESTMRQMVDKEALGFIKRELIRTTKENAILNYAYLKQSSLDLRVKNKIFDFFDTEELSDTIIGQKAFFERIGKTVKFNFHLYLIHFM